jgi:hypothetical protein
MDKEPTTKVEKKTYDKSGQRAYDKSGRKAELSKNIQCRAH